MAYFVYTGGLLIHFMWSGCQLLHYGSLQQGDFVFSPCPTLTTHHIGRRTGRCTVGFGFDHESRSYKVVKILGLWVRDTYHWVNCAEVYTFGSGSWRVICADVVQNLKMDDGKISACTNNDGVFHWRWQDYDNLTWVRRCFVWHRCQSCCTTPRQG